jgi:hypothetical protein
MKSEPLKADTKEKLEALMQKKTKETQVLHPLPPYTVIFCEGTKTEPLYIRGFTERINKKYEDMTPKERITVIGTGRSGKSLLDYARKKVKTEFPECQVVWLMYDKDYSSDDDFDNTQFSAQDRASKQEYRVAWSNECIELWFLLHFRPLFSQIGRKRYKEILREYFPYRKNALQIYDILKDKTDIAIARAKTLYESYEKNTPPSKRIPATRMHELIAFLREYL